MKKVRIANNNETQRIQATLFIDEPFKESIEKIRRKYNPEQYNLIGGHITLLRDDELTGIKNVIKNLSELNEQTIEIDLGKLRRSDDGKGLLIEGKGYLQTIVIAPMTSNSKNYPTRVPVKHGRTKGWVVLDQRGTFGGLDCSLPAAHSNVT